MAAVLALAIAVVCSMFLSNVIATTERTVLASEDFSAETINGNVWESDDIDLYAIDDDELAVDGENIADIDDNLPDSLMYLSDTFTNTVLNFDFEMKVMPNDGNLTAVYGAVFDPTLMHSEAQANGLYVGVLFIVDAGDDTMRISIISRNASFELGGAIDQPLLVSGKAADVYYMVSITLNRTSDAASVQIINVATGASVTCDITDLYPVDADTELTFGVGGAYITSGGYNKGGNGINVVASLQVGTFDNIEVSATTVTATTTPVVTSNDRSAEISWWIIAIGALILIGTGAAYKWGKDIQTWRYYTAVVGVGFIVFGFANMVFGWVKTIPYIAT